MAVSVASSTVHIVEYNCYFDFNATNSWTFSLKRSLQRHSFSLFLFIIFKIFIFAFNLFMWFMLYLKLLVDNNIWEAVAQYANHIACVAIIFFIMKRKRKTVI